MKIPGAKLFSTLTRPGKELTALTPGRAPFFWKVHQPGVPFFDTAASKPSKPQN
jgi:hypothetical protein